MPTTRHAIAHQPIKRLCLLMLTGLCILSCGSQKPTPNPASEIAEQTPTQKPLKANINKPAFKVIETLRIKAQADDEEQPTWGGFNPHISFNAAGEIYITDQENDRVLKYSKSGQLLDTVAEKGSSAGQFYELAAYHVLNDGTAVAFDTNQGTGRLQWFDSEGSFQKNSGPANMQRILSNAVPSPDGRHIAADFVALNPSNGTLTFQTGILNSDLQPVKTLFAAVRPAPNPNRFNDPAYWVDYLSHTLRLRFHGFGVTSFDGAGHAYTAVTNTYKITKWQDDFKTEVYTIETQTEPKALDPAWLEAFIDQQTIEIKAAFPAQLQKLINRDVVAQAVAKAEPPKTQLPLYGLINMPDGHLLAVSEFDSVSGKGKADVYDPKGQAIGTIEMDHFALLGSDLAPRIRFGKAVAYTVETDSQGQHRAVRYDVLFEKAE